MPTPSTFNWETGSWTDQGSFSPDMKICIAGDWAPIRKFQPMIEKAPDAVYGDLLGPIRSADLSVVNLEAPLSDRGEPVCKSGAVFKGKTKHVNGLLAVPFDIVTMANNHVFDFGLDAFEDTMAVLDKNKIHHTGAGMSPGQAATPLTIDCKGTEVGIVNFSEGEDLTAAVNGPGVMGWDLETAVHQIKKLKKKKVFVIAVSHCGIEYIPFPPPYVVDAFERMADAGADLVIGHHPHVPQGISFHNRAPICYSLGNFVFYQETELTFRKLGYMVTISIKNKRLVSLDIVPYQIHDQGLALLKGGQKSRFFEKFKEISMPLFTRKGVKDSWNGFLDHYGTSGLLNEIDMIRSRMDNDLEKGTAMFRNRLTTLQHFNHLKDLSTRIINGQMNTAPGWSKELAHEWLSRTIPLDSH